jgi:uncharacterized membrane protein
MILMAIDHVRDFFHFDAFLYSPVDLQRTSGALFVTRWITHLCAPTFIFLAGFSAYFISKKGSINDTALFLFTRGVWLIVLQFTLIRFAWSFDPGFHYNSNTIISLIGICMIVQAGLIYFQWKVSLILGVLMVTGHNLFDGIVFPHGTTADVIWSFLHVQKSYELGDGFAFTFLYPVIPWVGVMALGYCFGRLYDSKISPARRKKMLLGMGLSLIVLVILIRYVNVYGDPTPWVPQRDLVRTTMSFFNLEKYPPSMLFLMTTLGIALLMLVAAESEKVLRFKAIVVFGKVALFYYVMHIFLIHLLAIAAAVATGFPWGAMIFKGALSAGNPLLIGRYGFSLPYVYAVWIVVVLLLYPLSLYWHRLKVRNKTKWWTSYV